MITLHARSISQHVTFRPHVVVQHARQRPCKHVHTRASVLEHFATSPHRDVGAAAVAAVGAYILVKTFEHLAAKGIMGKVRPFCKIFS